MAIIDKDTRMTVATRLANLKEALKHDKEEE